MPNELLLPPSGERLINANGTDVTADVYGPIRKTWGQVTDPGDKEALKKAGEVVTTADGLVAIDLEAPSRNLYPVLTPIRNAIPRRTVGSGAGLGPQWREVRSISGSPLLPAQPWLREGGRAARMDIDAVNRSADYVTLGLDTDVTFEAQHAAQGFEDEYAMAALRLLHQLMRMEEDMIVGANRSVALGATATPTLSASGTGATLPAATYSVRCFALTFEGYRNWRFTPSTAQAIFRQVTLTGADGQTYTINGGSSAAGAAATQAVTLGQTLFMSVPVIRGAVAYAWFVGTAGNERLERVSTINSAAISAPLAGTGQTLVSITDAATDRSFNNGTAGNNAPAYNGLLYGVYAGPTTGSGFTIVETLATGTAGTGTVLTATDRGIAQIDNVLRAMWDNYQLSPEVIWCSAQEADNIANKLYGGTATGKVRYSITLNPSGEVQAGVAGIQYNNLYAQPANGSPTVPIRVHPTLTPGTMLFWLNNLPAQYLAANVPVVAQVQARRDYYQIPWPQVTRRQETGVYAETVLKNYFPPALAILTNIANG